MSAFRLERPAEAFAFTGKAKKPRKQSAAHLAFVRTLPCVVCLKHPVEAAHIRTGSPPHGKRETGAGEKPSDQWVLPLCAPHHREQHATSETAFHALHGLNPFETAALLYAMSGDEEAGLQIIRRAKDREHDARP